MKVVAISTPEEARERLISARDMGYVTFIYDHVDPKHELLEEGFLYVSSDDELKEKLHLLKMDISTVDLLRW